MERGIILNQFALAGAKDGTHSLHVDPGNTELPRLALYWDQIDMPKIRIGNSEIATDSVLGEQVLIDEGVLKRSEFVLRPADGFRGVDQMMTAVVVAPFVVFERNEQAAPGKWAIAQNTRNLIVPQRYQGDANRDRTLLLELHSVLPTPQPDIPIKKILHWKRQHADELTELRQALDEICRKISEAADPEQVLAAETKRIEEALAEWKRACESSGIARLQQSVIAHIKSEPLDSVRDAVAFASTAGAAIGAPSVETIFAAVGAASVVWNRAKNISLAIRDPVRLMSPAGKVFAFAYHAGRLKQ
jgi:hypothetical protein